MIWEIMFGLLLVAAVAGAVFVLTPFVKAYLAEKMPSSSLFKPRPEKRLDIVEQSNLDGRRRLVLIRRDDVEHLIMTGGPVDVVIEQNIAHKRLRTAEVVEGPQPAYSRPPRTLGQAVGEQ